MRYIIREIKKCESPYIQPVWVKERLLYNAYGGDIYARSYVGVAGKNTFIDSTKREPFYRRFIRWLYINFLDELYIPKGTELIGKRLLAGRSINQHKRFLRWGNQEAYFSKGKDNNGFEIYKHQGSHT